MASLDDGDEMKIGIITTDDMKDLKMFMSDDVEKANIPLCGQYLCACAAKWKSRDLEFIKEMVEWFWRGKPN